MCTHCIQSYCALSYPFLLSFFIFSSSLLMLPWLGPYIITTTITIRLPSVKPGFMQLRDHSFSSIFYPSKCISVDVILQSPLSHPSVLPLYGSTLTSGYTLESKCAAQWFKSTSNFKTFAIYTFATCISCKITLTQMRNSLLVCLIWGSLRIIHDLNLGLLRGFQPLNFNCACSLWISICSLSHSSLVRIAFRFQMLLLVLNGF